MEGRKTCRMASDLQRLQWLLRQADRSDTRLAAAWMLGRACFKAGARQALLQSLRDTHESPRVRAQAAQALGSCDPRSPLGPVIGALIGALDHPDVAMRYQAAGSLGKLQAQRAVPWLLALARTDARYCPGQGRVDEQARQALRRIKAARGRASSARRLLSSGGPDEQPLRPG
jgi:HEAT repeat protein